ncbi:family 16 glycosylhydrolase [Mesobacillus subterraneus]|uniref:Glycosyl hydrolase family protein n=1 Tax=Mesobacillus subterraneus TaxID=285983 RepID=A0A3R9E607_9BACI|nr:glycosyl hydrolase family protein [Mesobacillus subterraneus]
MEWEPGEFRWYVDGILYATQNEWFSKSIGTGVENAGFAPFDREFYLQLNLAVGGKWPGYPDETTTFPQQMSIDYIKVFIKED